MALLMGVVQAADSGTAAAAGLAAKEAALGTSAAPPGVDLLTARVIAEAVSSAPAPAPAAGAGRKVTVVLQPSRLTNDVRGPPDSSDPTKGSTHLEYPAAAAAAVTGVTGSKLLAPTTAATASTTFRSTLDPQTQQRTAATAVSAAAGAPAAATVTAPLPAPTEAAETSMRLKQWLSKTTTPPPPRPQTTGAAATPPPLPMPPPPRPPISAAAAAANAAPPRPMASAPPSVRTAPTDVGATNAVTAGGGGSNLNPPMTSTGSSLAAAQGLLNAAQPLASPSAKVRQSPVSKLFGAARPPSATVSAVTAVEDRVQRHEQTLQLVLKDLHEARVRMESIDGWQKQQAEAAAELARAQSALRVQRTALTELEQRLVAQEVLSADWGPTLARLESRSGGSSGATSAVSGGSSAPVGANGGKATSGATSAKSFDPKRDGGALWEQVQGMQGTLEALAAQVTAEIKSVKAAHTGLRQELSFQRGHASTAAPPSLPPAVAALPSRVAALEQELVALAGAVADVKRSGSSPDDDAARRHTPRASSTDAATEEVAALHARIKQQDATIESLVSQVAALAKQRQGGGSGASTPLATPRSNGVAASPAGSSPQKRQQGQEGQQQGPSWEDVADYVAEQIHASELAVMAELREREERLEAEQKKLATDKEKVRSLEEANALLLHKVEFLEDNVANLCVFERTVSSRLQSVVGSTRPTADDPLAGAALVVGDNMVGFKLPPLPRGSGGGAAAAAAALPPLLPAIHESPGSFTNPTFGEPSTALEEGGEEEEVSATTPLKRTADVSPTKHKPLGGAAGAGAAAAASERDEAAGGGGGADARDVELDVLQQAGGSRARKALLADAAAADATPRKAGSTPLAKPPAALVAVVAGSSSMQLAPSDAPKAACCVVQ